MATQPPRVFLTCAELSADKHLANLARAVHVLRPDIELEGIGGEAMRQAGVRVHHETVRGARWGLGAFIRAREMFRIFRWTRRRFREAGPPQLMVCCDSWTMNKHFLSIARAFEVPTLYYISPQVWASREGRIRRMRRTIDRMAVILPFEETWLVQRGLDATFVGHPLFDELGNESPAFDAGERFPNRAPIVALIPGSRRKVAADNFPRLLEVAELILAQFPQASFVTPTVEATHELARQALGKRHADWERLGRIEIACGKFEDLVGRADVAVCVSGTATLHTAALGVPLVSVFMAPRLGWLVARFMVKTRTFALVNWLHPRREHVVPEFIPWFGDAAPVAQKVLEWLGDPQRLAQQRAAQAAVVDPLRRKGASANAAGIVVQMIEQNRGD